MPHWYLAELILEHRIDGEPRNVVTNNTLLVEADSPEEAWERALDLGREAETVYVNTDDRQVSVRFRGLRELQEIQEDLEHGAELLYSEKVGVPEEVLVEMIPARHELAVFTGGPLPEVDDPNLIPHAVLEEEEVPSGLGALEAVEPGKAPSGEALRFARHAALVAASELRRQGLTDQARGTEYLAEALEHMLTLG